jgi:hypothetical protein
MDMHIYAVIPQSIIGRKTGLKYLSLLLLLVIWQSGGAQVTYGTNSYVEYHQGTLPVVIAVPHGGAVSPAALPNRTCNDAVTVTDLNTIELAQQIDAAFFAQTGCHPHLIYCNLRRTKLDCNRNLADGACGNPAAALAWTEYHRFIEQAQASAQQEYEGNILFIDLHGHGHPLQRLELGYLLYGDELRLSDQELNTPPLIAVSAIQNLVADNANNYTHAALLRGPQALGTLLGEAGFPAVPSAQIPAPAAADSYFSGGYTTVRHTSYTTGNTVNGLQIECNLTGVRDNATNRQAFGEALSTAVLDFLRIHREVAVENCQPVAVEDLQNSPPGSISPTVWTRQDAFVLLKDLPTTGGHYEVYNNLGQRIIRGDFVGDRIALPGHFTPGFYSLHLRIGQQGWTFRVVVN